ncbi:MAG TPA: anthranilate phosphoribosyltransferase [Porticoccaceae bacterium]|nr:anthranilate phosphoribosyltransferase [Porticoccaceae bacterium]
MVIKQALSLVMEGQHLSREIMFDVMAQIMSGGATDAQIGAFLVGLRLKGETIDEITGAVEVMRQLATKVNINGEHLVDIVGTGGDESNLFNVSTIASVVVAAAGGRVAKHGNRSVSSKSGAADLLETAGVNLSISPTQVALCVDQIGLGFMFAPAHHSAMKYAIGPRKELGLRTIFNILGPMTNPAGVKRQLIGVYDQALCRPIAEVLGRLGAEHVMVVHSADGLDEISIAAETYVAEYKLGVLSEYSLLPEDFFGRRQTLDGLCVDNAEQSLKLIFSALDGNTSKAADLISINAGAALYVAGCVQTINEGVSVAQKAISSGDASRKINQLVALTNSFTTDK